MRMLKLNDELFADDSVCAIMFTCDRVNAHVNFDVLELRFPGEMPFRLAVRTSAVTFSPVPKMRDADATSNHKFKLRMFTQAVSATKRKSFVFEFCARPNNLTISSRCRQHILFC